MTRRSTLVLPVVAAFVALSGVPATAYAKAKPCPGPDPEIDVVYLELTRVEGHVLHATLKDPMTGALSREVDIKNLDKTGWTLELSQWRASVPFPVTRRTLQKGLIPELAGYVFTYWAPPDGVLTELETAPGATRCAARIRVDAFRKWTLQVAARPTTFHIPAFCNRSCSGEETEITTTLDERSESGLRVILNKDTVCSFAVEVTARDTFPKTISHQTIIKSLASTCTDWRTLEFVAARRIPQEIVVTQADR